MKGTPTQLLILLEKLDKNKIYEIKEYREKRSKSQNAYAWELIGKLADVLRKSKEEIYFQMLKDYGQSEIMSILSDINPKGFLKYYEEIGDGTVNNKKFTHYRVYKGSSEFDTKEMSIFIDGIIQECKQQDIETLTPEQIAKMEVF